MRGKVHFSAVTKAFAACGRTSHIIEIYPGKNVPVLEKEFDMDTPIKVRLIRIDLPNGEIELLMISLLDRKKYPNRIFKELYFKRRKVETFYDELKNKLKVEHFSGYSNQSILQNFNAAIFICNIQILIVGDLEEELRESTKNRKLVYKVNTNLSYGFKKNKIITLFFSNNDIGDIVTKLKTLFKQNLVSIRSNRSNQRNIGKYRRW